MMTKSKKKQPIKNILLSVIFFVIAVLPCCAFEDYIISTDGKLTDIKIEHNDIIDVYPFYTIMNEKNTLCVHPLKVGKTRFCVLKDKKDIVMFDVEVKENSTIISEREGFENLSIDMPPAFESEYNFKLDAPPLLKKGGI